MPTVRTGGCLPVSARWPPSSNLRQVERLPRFLSKLHTIIACPICARTALERVQHEMTPEERFTKMENLLYAMMEHQARQLEEQGAETNKQNAGIRDLIVVSRTILTNSEKVTEQINQLRETQAGTDERLNILIAEDIRIISGVG